jgi:hypothetical protein
MDFSFIEDPTVREAAEKKYAESIDGLKKKNEEVISEKRKLAAEKLELQAKFEGIDVEKAKEALLLQQDIKKKELLDKGKVEEMIQMEVTSKTSRIQSDYEAKMAEIDRQAKEAQAQLMDYQQRYQSKIMEDHLRKIAVESGCHNEPAVIEDIITRGRQIYKLNEKENGIEARDSNGDLLKDAEGQLLVPEKWIAGLKKSCPHYFPASSSTNSFGGRNSGRGTGDLQTALNEAASSGNMELYKAIKKKIASK